MENAKILTEAQIKAIETLAELIQQAVATVVKMVKRVYDCIRDFVRTVVENYNNKRVIHLALHHKDKRVKNKNMNRILKWYWRFVKCRE